MSNTSAGRFTRPETLAALGIIGLSGAFLIPTLALKPISALLPGAMLAGLVVLGGLMLLADQRKAAAAEAARPMTTAPMRVLGAFALIVLYTVAVDLLGFYPSTAVSVPLVAHVFGYRNLRGLALAPLIVVAGIWGIFSFAMSQEFPVGRLWGM